MGLPQQLDGLQYVYNEQTYISAMIWDDDWGYNYSWDLRSS